MKNREELNPVQTFHMENRLYERFVAKKAISEINAKFGIRKIIQTIDISHEITRPTDWNWSQFSSPKCSSSLGSSYPVELRESANHVCQVLVDWFVRICDSNIRIWNSTVF